MASLDVVELGAELVGVDLDDDGGVLVARYQLITPRGERLGCGGEIRIGYDTLDGIDARLGGSRKLTPSERLDLAGRILQPLFVGRFQPLPMADPSTETGTSRNVTIHAHGEVVALCAPSVQKGV